MEYGESVTANARPVPASLRRQLMQARRIESIASSGEQRLRAIRATARLLSAAVQAGWRVSELADAIGMQRSTAAVRVRRVHATSEQVAGIAVPGPPVPDTPDSDLPLDERRWLRAREVRQLLGVSNATIGQWLNAGLLPRTRSGTRARYLREDVDRLRTAPRRGRCGIDRAAVLRLIEQQPAPLTNTA